MLQFIPATLCRPRPIRILRNSETDSKFSIIDEKSELSSLTNYNNSSTSPRFKGVISFGTEVLTSYGRGYVLTGSIPESILIKM